MKYNIIKNRYKKITAWIMLANVIFILLYKIIRSIVATRNYLFRGWVDSLFIGNVMFLIILAAISINLFLSSKLYSKIKNVIMKSSLKIISTIVMLIIVIVCCLGGAIVFMLTYAPEHIIDNGGKRIIAKVGPSFLDTTVNYYEPVNILLMKKSNIESETYKGGYDRYEK